MAARKLPKKFISVMGHSIEIIYDANLDHDKVEAEFRPNTYPMTIAINPKSKYPLQQLVLHESLHAILYLAGLTNVLHDDLEEAVVTAIEHGLAPHVDMNPSIKGKA